MSNRDGPPMWRCSRDHRAQKLRSARSPAAQVLGKLGSSGASGTISRGREGQQVQEDSLRAERKQQPDALGRGDRLGGGGRGRSPERLIFEGKPECGAVIIFQCGGWRDGNKTLRTVADGEHLGDAGEARRGPGQESGGNNHPVTSSACNPGGLTLTASAGCFGRLRKPRPDGLRDPP